MITITTSPNSGFFQVDGVDYPQGHYTLGYSFLNGGIYTFSLINKSDKKEIVTSRTLADIEGVTTWGGLMQLLDTLGVLNFSTGGDSGLGAIVEWMLATDNYELPLFLYGASEFQINTSGVLSPIILGGTTPFQSWQISSGVLPSEFALDPLTGAITYVTTSAVKSGTFGVTATNYKGVSDEVLFNYNIRAAQGITEFTNSLVIYPAMRISYAPTTTDMIFLKLQGFYGNTQSTGNGEIVASNDAIYYRDTGQTTVIDNVEYKLHDYLIKPSTYGYWNIYRDSITQPIDIAAGYVSDLKTSLLDYDLVAPYSDLIIGADGKNYPSDQTDVHYLTSLRYLHLGVDASLNGFMADDHAFSYGFRLVDAIPEDSLGRTMFTREGRNWLGFYIGQNATYANMIYGNGANRSYDGEDVYTGQIAAGTWITVTSANGSVKIYADGTQIFSYAVSSYWDSATSVNSLNISFGNGVESNANQTLGTNYFHGLWQGVIADMWINNTQALTAGQTAVPVSATHHWTLAETEGNTFAPSVGTVTIEGRLKS